MEIIFSLNQQNCLIIKRISRFHGFPMSLYLVLPSIFFSRCIDFRVASAPLIGPRWLLSDDGFFFLLGLLTYVWSFFFALGNFCCRTFDDRVRYPSSLSTIRFHRIRARRLSFLRRSISSVFFFNGLR